MFLLGLSGAAPAPMGITCSSGQVVPRWAAVSLSACLAGFLTAALGWLALAILGILSTPAAIALAVLAGGPAAALTARAVLGHPTTESSRTPSVWWLAAVGVAIALSVWNGFHHAEHVVVDRDPGVYLVTAKWLSDERGLYIDGPTGAFEDEEGIRPVGAGFYGARGDDAIDAQFAHLTPAVVGVAARVGGDAFLFVTNAIIGGIALVVVFAAAATLMPARWAFVAICGLAASFPFIYFSRDVYSEPLAMLVLFGGFFVWELASVRPHALLGLLAGSLIGASCAARIDGFISVVPATAAFALYAAGRGAPGDQGAPRRVGIAALVAMAAVAALGWFDVRYFSTGYYTDALEPQLGSLLLGAAIAGLAVALAAPLMWRPSSSQQTLVATGVLSLASVGAIAATLYARFVRPDPASVEDALAAGELGTRDIDTLAYSQAMEWPEWYLGPFVLALGVAGLVGLTWKGLRTPGARSSLLFCGVVATTTVVYMYEPTITAVQVWAMRRFLPLTLPGLVVAAAWVLAVLVNRWRGPRWYQVSVWVAGAAALVLPAVLVSWPVRDARVQAPMRRGVDAVCEAAGRDAAIMVSGPGQVAITLPESLRAFCRVPVGSTAEITPADILRLEDEWARDGRDLVVVSAVPDPFPGLVAREKDHVFGAQVRAPDQPRTRAPSRLVLDERLELTPDKPVYHLWVLRSFDAAS